MSRIIDTLLKRFDTAPALDRPEFWQALGDDAPKYLSGVVTKGFMPPVAGASDEELAAIASWVLGTLGETGQRPDQRRPQGAAPADGVTGR